MPRRTDLDTEIGTLVFGQAKKGKKKTVYTTESLPARETLAKLPEDEQIAVVCQRYKLWLLDFAQQLAKKPNTGYAVLALLNSYFDMIASLSGYGNRKSTDRVRRGIRMVFKDVSKQPNVINMLVMYLRNPMAHMGTTGDYVVLIDHFDEPLVWGPFRKKRLVLVINPRVWANHIDSHFDEFTSQLLDSHNKQLRKHFLERVSRKA